MSFNLKDSNNQILTAGESLAKEDQNFKGSIIYLATGSDDDDNNNDDNNDFSKSTQRQETLLNRILFSNDHFSYDRLPVSI